MVGVNAHHGRCPADHAEALTERMGHLNTICEASGKGLGGMLLGETASQADRDIGGGAEVGLPVTRKVGET